MRDNLSKGKLGESIASKYLSSKGFKIIQMNFYKRWGEIDIVCIDPSTEFMLSKAEALGTSPSAGSRQDTLVFVEVKTRMEGDRISPEESITRHKINSLKKSGLYYKNLHPEFPDLLRIDFVGIVLNQEYKPIKINHIKNICN